MADDPINALLARIPDLDADGKLTGPSPAAASEVFAGCMARGAAGLTALIDRLKEVDNGEDYRVRYVLHGLAVWLRDPEFKVQRSLFNGVLTAGASGPRHPAVRGFLVRQLQVCGTHAEVPALARLLHDADLCEYAAQAILAIGVGADEAFRDAFGSVPKALRLTIIQGVLIRQDPKAVPILRQAARDAAVEVRLAALLGLARSVDRSAVDLLLAGADTEGNERIVATNACLEMAENLITAKHTGDARRIYHHLYRTRTDPAEQYVRDLAQAGMMASGFRDLTPPTSPGNLTAASVGSRAVKLSWKAAVDRDSAIWHYAVYRNDTQIAVVGPGDGGRLDTIDGTAEDGVFYTYAVRAVNLGKTESRPATVRLRFLDKVPPRPLTVACYADSPAKVRITFSKPMDRVQAAIPERYRVSANNTVNMVKSVTVAEDGAALVLHLAAALARDNTYRLIMEPLVDQAVARNAITNREMEFTVIARRPGIRYACYEAVLGDSLEAYLAATPAKTGITEKVDVSVRTRDDEFSLKFDGIVEVPAAGEYTFYTSSDDGSRLYINGEVVVRNDGLHGTEEKAGTVRLPVGGHRITVTFFEQGGGEVLSASWEGPGIDKHELPAAVLFHVPE